MLSYAACRPPLKQASEKRLPDLTFSKFSQLAARQTLGQEEANLESIRKGHRATPKLSKSNCGAS
jgi:hypothetical protein